MTCKLRHANSFLNMNNKCVCVFDYTHTKIIILQIALKSFEYYISI